MSIKLDRVSIVVADMKKSLDFYRLLGFDIPETGNNEHHVEVRQGGCRLAFDPQEAMKSVLGKWETPTGHRVEIAFLCDSKDILDELYKKVIDSGYAGYLEPLDMAWGERYAMVEDPDGNLISLIAS